MTTEEHVPPAGRRQKLTLVILGLIFLAPALSAWLIFNFTNVGRDNGGKVNHGDLVVPPRKIANIVLSDPLHKGQPQRLYGKWSIVYLVSGGCDKTCDYKLYTMRQLRLAMGRDDDRVQRILVVYGSDATVLSEVQEKNYAGQLLVRASKQLQAVFKLTDTEQPLNLHRLYIVDPRGNLMMSYRDGTNPTDIIKDLKRLLKYSRIG